MTKLRRTVAARLASLIYDALGFVCLLVAVLLLAGIPLAVDSRTKSLEFLEQRAGLAKQCKEMLNMGNYREELVKRAKDFNSQLADYQSKLQHPIAAHFVDMSVLKVQPIKCTEE